MIRISPNFLGNITIMNKNGELTPSHFDKNMQLYKFIKKSNVLIANFLHNVRTYTCIR